MYLPVLRDIPRLHALPKPIFSSFCRSRQWLRCTLSTVSSELVLSTTMTSYDAPFWQERLSKHA